MNEELNDVYRGAKILKRRTELARQSGVNRTELDELNRLYAALDRYGRRMEEIDKRNLYLS